MRLIFLRGECSDGRTCPNINLTDRQTYVVQGYAAGDSTVEIPRTLLPELSDDHSAGGLQLTHRDTILVSGRVVTDRDALRELDLPVGEAAVEIPISSLPPEVGGHAR